jgi:hypothetical protein
LFSFTDRSIEAAVWRYWHDIFRPLIVFCGTTDADTADHGHMQVRLLLPTKWMIYKLSLVTEGQSLLAIRLEETLPLPRQAGSVAKLLASPRMRLHCRGWSGGQELLQEQWQLHPLKQTQLRTLWFA